MKASDRLSTLFEWPASHAVQVVLPAMFIVAALAHIAGLAAFRLSPPAAPSAPRPEATVYALLPVSGGGRVMEPALSADDPALFSPFSSETRGVWQLAESDYRPSLAEMMPELRDLADDPGEMARLPPVMRVAPVPTPSRSGTTGPNPPAPGNGGVSSGAVSKIEFSGPLSSRARTAKPTGGFSAPEKLGLLPATFLVAVGPEGKFLHVFPLESSGYDALDRQAARALYQLHIDPAAETTWGTATFLWGTDVQRLRLE